MRKEVTLRSLLFTFIGLLILTGLSFALSLVGLGAWEMPVALVIAGAKATLVIIFFMHLLEEGASPLVAVITTIFFVVILATFVGKLDMESRNIPPLYPPSVTDVPFQEGVWPSPPGSPRRRGGGGD